ncbi:DUF4214 domain-containing protein [Paraburkholderia sp. CNPSo 3157]|uniref:DUF4214 domain-containing protein n=1 Tax=Paraburkholderia franconis TaxID=2654983 RepID=A0A7X1N9F7_9BURK|nr:S8 family serine peptidase [Paraburkholderia franconis]MPW17859.1 DUF4214 domain-containing protein [Paraburkholderia franconis]
MNVANYALIDDIQNTAGEHHADMVTATINNYVSQYGFSSYQTQAFQFPNSWNTEATQINSDVASITSPVVNNSWADLAASHSPNAWLTDGPDIYRALEDAFLSGKTMVFAAGNQGASSPNTASFEGSTSFVISVSAMDPDPNGHEQLASYSSANPAMTNYVTLGTVANYPQNPTAIGTSFAAPRITALISMLDAEYGGQLTQSDIHTILDQGSVGENLSQENQPNMPTYVYHVIDDTTFGNILHMQYTPGECTVRMEVSGLYNLLLDRVADTGGLNFYTNLAATQGLGVVGAQLKASPEYQTVSGHTINEVSLMEDVQAMYHVFLGRESDDVGLAWWVDHIAHDNAPTNQQISITGQHIDISQYEQAFVAAAGQHLPSWF